MWFTKLGDLLTVGPSWELPGLGAARLCEWGGGSPDLSGSESTIQQDRMASVAALQGATQQAQNFLAPWRQLGGGAAGVLGGLYNIPGYQAVDPTQTLTRTPGYQWLQDQGTQALARYGSATGLALSGPASKSAQTFGQQTALNNAWTPYINELNFMSGQGLQGAGQSGQLALQGAGLEAQTWMQGSQQLAGLQRQQALYNQQAQNSMWNDVMQGVGLVGSLALAPATGGTSLLGSAVSGLQDAWGNLTGSYMPVSPGMPGMNVSQMSNVGAGSTGAFSPTPAGTWIPMMAGGGSLGAGQSAIVGEKGPELFVPRTDGYIVPNYALPRYAEADQYGTNAFAPWRNAA